MPFGTGLARGMAVTFSKLFTKPITTQYPKEKWQVAERSRGELHLRRWEDGSLKCVACQLCARACPDSLIDIETTKLEDGTQLLTSWKWESYACMFCGLCADACPWDSLEMTGAYELGRYRFDLLWRYLAEDEPVDTIQHHRAVAKADEEVDAS